MASKKTIHRDAVQRAKEFKSQSLLDPSQRKDHVQAFDERIAARPLSPPGRRLQRRPNGTSSDLERSSG